MSLVSNLRRVWNVPSSVTYTMISLVILGYQRLSIHMKPQIRLNWDIAFQTSISQFSIWYPGITRHMTYPGISLWYFVWNRILRLNLTKPDLYQLFAFPMEKREQLGYISTNELVLGYPGIGHMSSYPVIVSDIPSVFFGNKFFPKIDSNLKILTSSVTSWSENPLQHETTQ